MVAVAQRTEHLTVDQVVEGTLNGCLIRGPSLTPHLWDSTPKYDARPRI